jgi:outer membrane receptor for ferrienterochelin and colicin
VEQSRSDALPDNPLRSPRRLVTEALRLAPGVEVARIDANKWSIEIRGFDSRLSRSVLVLIDGRTVYTELFARTSWEVQVRRYIESRRTWTNCWKLGCV